MKLQPLLTEYLIEYGNVPLAGVGSLSVEQKSAVLREESYLLTPPAQHIIFSADIPSAAEQQKLVDFVCQRLRISENEASFLVNEEGSFQEVFKEADTFNWLAVGHFQKQPDGTIFFAGEDAIGKYLPSLPLASLKPQPSPKLTTEKTTQATIVEETALVYNSFETLPKNRWWIWPLVIFIVAVALIVARFYLSL